MTDQQLNLEHLWMPFSANRDFKNAPRLMNEAKGNMWKGPFHVPRMQWMAAELCDAMAGSREE